MSGIAALGYAPIISAAVTPEIIPEIGIEGSERVSVEHEPIIEKEVKPKKKSSTNVVSLFFLGALIFLVVFAWISLLNILINVYYELIFPSTTTKEEHLTTMDFILSVIKQITFALILTLILIVYMQYMDY